MKITKRQLLGIIKEELSRINEEAVRKRKGDPWQYKVIDSRWHTRKDEGSGWIDLEPPTDEAKREKFSSTVLTLNQEFPQDIATSIGEKPEGELPTFDDEEEIQKGFEITVQAAPFDEEEEEEKPEGELPTFDDLDDDEEEAVVKRGGAGRAVDHEERMAQTELTEGARRWARLAGLLKG